MIGFVDDTIRNAQLLMQVLVNTMNSPLRQLEFT